MCAICKIVFILSHGQSFTERGFSINHRWLTIVCRKNHWHRKGLCMQFIMVVVLSYLVFKLHLLWGKAVYYQRYKLELEKNAKEKANNSADLKHKIKHEIQKLKKQKMDLEATIKALKGYLCNKTITSQNVSSEG